MRNVILVLLCSFMVACKSNFHENTQALTPTNSTPPHLETVLERIDRESTRIETDAKVIIEESVKLPIGESNNKIRSKAENIIESSETLKEENVKLSKVIQEVDKNEKELARLQDLIKSAYLDALNKLYGYIRMFWVLGFSAIIAGCLLAFLFGNRMLGSTIAITGIMMIGFAAASQYYMQQIAFVGAILLITSFVGGLGYLVWGIYRSNMISTAVREIVEMIEILKETMTEGEKKRIFGDDGLASKVQSSITKKVVAKIRENNHLRTLEDIKKDP